MCRALHGGTDWLFFKGTQRFDTQNAAETSNLQLMLQWCDTKIIWVHSHFFPLFRAFGYWSVRKSALSWQMPNAMEQEFASTCLNNTRGTSTTINIITTKDLESSSYQILYLAQSFLHPCFLRTLRGRWTWPQGKTTAKRGLGSLGLAPGSSCYSTFCSLQA